MPPQIRDHHPQIDLRITVQLRRDALWDVLLETVPQRRRVSIARSGPDRMLCRITGRSGETGEFEVRWASTAPGTHDVRTAIITRLERRSLLPWRRRRLDAHAVAHYRLAVARIREALAAHVVEADDAPASAAVSRRADDAAVAGGGIARGATVRRPIIDPALVRHLGVAFPPPPAHSVVTPADDPTPPSSARPHASHLPATAPA